MPGNHPKRMAARGNENQSAWENISISVGPRSRMGAARRSRISAPARVARYKADTGKKVQAGMSRDRNFNSGAV